MENSPLTQANYEEKLLNAEKIIARSKLVYENFSKKVSNMNRKTQFNLGTDKAVKDTEFSEKFKNFRASPEPLPVASPKEVKNHHFVLGSYNNLYQSTNSATYEHQSVNAVEVHKKNQVQNIVFGDQKAKMISSMKMDFTQKPLKNLTKEEMDGVRESHRNCHFTLGNYETEFKPTSKDYRAFSTTPSRKKSFEDHQNILLGNFKQSLITEKQDNFRKKEIVLDLYNDKTNIMKKTNFCLGNNQNVLMSTAEEAFKPKEITQFSKIVNASPNNHIVLGNSPSKWESSYKSNFYEKGHGETQSSEKKIEKNFVFGHSAREIQSIAKESYSKKPFLSATPQLRNAKNNQIFVGGFRNQFETVNSNYGKNTSGVEKPDTNFDKYKSVQFSFGNDPRELKSKFQNDYGQVPVLGKREKIIDKNRMCNIVFGDNKFRWGTTYSDLKHN